MKFVSKNWVGAAVTIILSLHFIMAFTSLTRKSLVFDEPAHIVGGLNCWKNNDYSMTPDNGLLPQKIIAFPLLFLKAEVPPPESREWNDNAPEQIQKKLLFGDFKETGRILFSARTAILCISVLTGLAVFFISRSIFGTAGGFVSLILYSFCPSILAHSRFATSDLVATSTFLMSVWAFWRLLHKINIPNVLLSSISLAFLCLSKMSFFIIIPACLALILLKMAEKTPVMICSKWKRRELDTQSAQLKTFICLIVVNILLVTAIIWAFYGFRYEMHPKVSLVNKASIERNWNNLIVKTGTVGKIANFAREKQILPEAFIYGFLSVYQYSKHRYSFMNGELSETGWWTFFPYAFLTKTPVPFFIILILAIFAIRRKPSHAERNEVENSNGSLFGKFHDILPYLVFIIIYFLFAVVSKINIGHRHILPIYPPLFIICGGISYLFASNATDIIRKLRLPAILLVAWFCLDSLSAWPDYLSYFNRLAGGPENGYKHLVDSSLDWGQDLSNVNPTLEKHKELNSKNLYISYFGVDIPERFSIQAKILPGYHLFDRKSVFRLEEGTYIISATMLQMVYFAEMLYNETGLVNSQLDEELFVKSRDAAEHEISKFGGNPDANHEPSKDYRIYNMLRFAKLYIYLRDRKPDASVGHSMLVFKLSSKEVKEALSPSP